MNEIIEVVQSPLFEKQKKKLFAKQILILDLAIKTIISEPEIGVPKVGDLSGVRVYKFKMEMDQILLAYEYKDHAIYLLTFGVHENFYKSLKKYRTS